MLYYPYGGGSPKGERKCTHDMVRMNPYSKICIISMFPKGVRTLR